MADDPKKPETEKRKMPWEMTHEDLEEALLKSINKGMHQYDGEPKRFDVEKNEYVEDVVDDSTLED